MTSGQVDEHWAPENFLFLTRQAGHWPQKMLREHTLPEGQDALCSGEMSAPIFSLARVTARPRRGLQLKIKYPSEVAVAAGKSEVP